MTIRNLDSETLNLFTVLKELVTNDNSSYVFLGNRHRLVIMVKLEVIRCELCGNVAIWYAVGKIGLLLFLYSHFLNFSSSGTRCHVLAKSKNGTHKELSKLQILVISTSG